MKTQTTRFFQRPRLKTSALTTAPEGFALHRTVERLLDAKRQMFASGKDQAEKPCTYCNRCLVNVVENPLGCYDERRFKTRDEMVAQMITMPYQLVRIGRFTGPVRFLRAR